jgi:hypothetical protein
LYIKSGPRVLTSNCFRYMAVSTAWASPRSVAIPVESETQLRRRVPIKQAWLTSIRDNDIQSVGHLSDLFDRLSVALFIVGYQLDNMDIGVFAGEIVELLRGCGIPSASEDDGVRLTFNKSKNEFVSDTPVGTRDWGYTGEYSSEQCGRYVLKYLRL